MAERGKKKISVLWRLCHFISKHWQLLLKAQGERLNPVPPHFRNPRGQASPTTPPFHRLGSQNQILPSCKHGLLMLQEHHHVAETISGRFAHNPSDFWSNFSGRHHLPGPSCPSLLAEGSARASRVRRDAAWHTERAQSAPGHICLQPKKTQIAAFRIGVPSALHSFGAERTKKRGEKKKYKSISLYNDCRNRWINMKPDTSHLVFHHSKYLIHTEIYLTLWKLYVLKLILYVLTMSLWRQQFLWNF